MPSTHLVCYIWIFYVFLFQHCKKQPVKPLTHKQLETWICTQHCGYWCPGAEALEHQYPKYGLDIHYIRPLSYKHIIVNNISEWNLFLMKQMAKLFKGRVSWDFSTSPLPFSVTLSGQWKVVYCWQSNFLNKKQKRRKKISDCVVSTVTAEGIARLGSEHRASILEVHFMTSSNRSIFHITRPLCGEFTSPRWIPLTKASDSELWCFFFIYTPEQTVE